MSDYSDLRRLIADVNKNFPNKEDEWSTFCTPLIVSLILDEIDHLQAALNRPDENIAAPVDNYEGLCIQFNALRTLYHSKLRQLEYWRRQSDDAYRADALKHRTEADCERDTNAMLTNALEVAEAERDRLANEVQRITELRRVEWANAKQDKAELCACIEDLALSLECEVNARNADTREHPALKRKYDSDMAEVHEARALIEKLSPPSANEVAALLPTLFSAAQEMATPEGEAKFLSYSNKVVRP